MKIRAGFVSNSSSTSFLIIAADDLTKKNFFDLMGVTEKSPLAEMFASLYDALLDRTEAPLDLKLIDDRVPVQDWLQGFRGDVSPRMMEKLKEAKQKGLRVYYGHLDSDGGTAESFFCCDSFEAENDKFYFNALECAW